MLGIVTVPATEAGKHSVEQILDKFLQGIQKSRGQDWKRTPIELGTINGLPFVRARWSGEYLRNRIEKPNSKMLLRGHVNDQPFS